MKIFFNLHQLFRMLLGSLKSRVKLTDEIYVHFIVWPWLTEFWRGLQASEFTSFTDAGRWELGGRTGLLKILFRNRAWVVIGGQKIIYRRAIPIFARVSVSIQIVGWEKEWFYVVHRFEAKGRVHALSFVRLAIRNKNGPIEVSKLVPPELNPRHPPEDIRSLFAADAELLALQAKSRR